MKKEAALIYGTSAHPYKFHDSHPFHPLRLELTYSLLVEIGALNDETPLISPRLATDEELSFIHDPDFIEAVKLASKGELSDSMAAAHGLNTEDTPMFHQMHEAAAYLVGGTLNAVDAVMSGNYQHAFHLGGGLHHGFRGRASGFCVYNDSSIAIEYLKQRYNARVLYIDTDAHHGDGVQWAFYDDPDVCTLSLHETGRYLFPGTGHVTEKGTGKGYGTSINIPLDAFTEDDSFISVYEKAFREVADFFKPDIIVTQNGVDAHHLDPLSHLHFSLKSYQAIPTLAHELAHQHCDGRWVAIGGGGYDKWRVVPRAWALIWLEMTNQTELAFGALPKEWRNMWEEQAEEPLPMNWPDPDVTPIPRRTEITAKNAQTLEKALYHIRTEKQR
ncbi:acetoin utilization protein AcuC [Shouchella shacheensis]|uniref:acetoin utilization protein AcuC n=1 Tax=Shouchella shacheensis TaxID=1649580 RepID=UPI00073FB865|nr:acetoin utilization protein AcuC [Shouchella shacheensis]